MVSYRCSCGMSHASSASRIEDVICENCGKLGADGGIVELTKDSDDIFASDIVWAWRFIKNEPLTVDGRLPRYAFGFKAGTPITEVCDWFVEELKDWVALDLYSYNGEF